MDNQIGEKFKQYKNVIIRSSQVGDDVMVGDDSFITDSIIGNHCSVERRSMIFNSIIGDYSYTGYNTVIKHTTIGKFTSMSWNVSIGGANHDFRHITNHPFPILKRFGICSENEMYSSFNNPLKIGNDVWIGSNVCILRNVHIGNGAVIGAGAVVTHDIGDYEIWAGVPAKKIGQRFSDQMIEKLQSLAWWNMPIDFISKYLDFFKCQLTPDLLDKVIEKANEFRTMEAK